MPIFFLVQTTSEIVRELAADPKTQSDDGTSDVNSDVTTGGRVQGHARGAGGRGRGSAGVCVGVSVCVCVCACVCVCVCVCLVMGTAVFIDVNTHTQTHITHTLRTQK